jgi:ABC-type multidrug transport system ATPase subunit
VLQGISDKKVIQKEVTEMIADLQLVGKSKIQSSRLSGGMKRKLRLDIPLKVPHSTGLSEIS